MEALIDDLSWWRVELEEPAFLIATRVIAPNRVLDGDAPVAGGGASQAAGSATAAVGPMIEQVEEQRTSRKRVSQNSRNHSLGTDGNLTANRRGTKLCPAFQRGQCSEGTGDNCPVDPNAKHQCARCLQPDHGAA